MTVGMAFVYVCKRSR